MNISEHSAIWVLMNAGWFSLAVGTFIGILGIWLGYIFYKRGRQVSRLSHLIGDAPIIGLAPTRYSDGLEVLFDGRRVSRVTSTSFGVWNSGTTTIYGRDIVEKDELRLELSGDGEMLRVTVESETRSVNGAMVSLSGANRATLGFDYLDPGDGFRVQALHSGAPKSLAVMGTIRGLPKGVELFGSAKAVDAMLRAFLMVLVGVAIALVVVVIAKVAVEIAREPLWKSLLYLAMFGCFATFVVWVWRRKDEPRQAPKIRGVPRVISEDPILSPLPIVVDTSQGPVQISREALERVTRNFPQ